MITYEKFCFAAAPFTGDTWFLDAAAYAGMGREPPYRAQVPFHSGPFDRLKVSLVRHPCDWLGSLWTQGNELEWLGKFRWLCRDQSFVDFVREYLIRFPGGIWRLFKSYEADSFLRFEDQPDAFVEFAKSIGVKKDAMKGSFFDRPPHNDNIRPWNQPLWREVVLAEDEMCQRFEYW